MAVSIEAMPEHFTARGELVEPHERADWGRAAPATLTGEDTRSLESTSGGRVSRAPAKHCGFTEDQLDSIIRHVIQYGKGREG